MAEDKIKLLEMLTIMEQATPVWWMNEHVKHNLVTIWKTYMKGNTTVNNVS